jgi:DNA-binding MarR family transcriptional regulator
VPTISCLAERMQLNHNSMVELVDRCEQNGLLRRIRSAADRRQVTLAISADGEALLRRMGAAARQELRNIGPVLVESVLRLTQDGRRPKRVSKTRKHRQTKTGVARKAGP